jgi:hypothetical protein
MKMLSPKQAEKYIELRDIGASPTKAKDFVLNRVSESGEMRAKKKSKGPFDFNFDF